MGLADLTGINRRYAGQAGKLVNEFYVPVLKCAVRYDRQAGYFDSSSLVQLASGLAGFIANIRSLPTEDHKPMRLVTGATWTLDDISAYQKGLTALENSLNQSLIRHFEPSDAECICLGLPPGWKPEEDKIARNRLGTLAWMVAVGMIEVRVALPLDHAGKPYHPGRHGALYHPKAGVIYDQQGNMLSFQGSVNETGAAWTRNREKFEVKRSWYSQQDLDDIHEEIREFETIWDGLDPGLLVLPLPRAVKDHLEAFVPPDGPPSSDPMEIDITGQQITLQDRIAAQWFLDAPKKPGGEHLAIDPLWADGKPFKPFPHQERVINRSTDEFPRSFLFCDEVGLGKTIEAGLSLRRLILQGKTSRVLILAPRSLVRQWMEELREKLALTAWFYNGRTLVDVCGNVRVGENLLDEDGIIIASRHLVARLDRRNEVIGLSRSWDILIVDEAHAARQKVFAHGGPNQLLELLQEMQARELFKCVWLLTATPMQLHPREVHDLLLLSGLADTAWKTWNTLPGFESFFNDLRIFNRNRDVRSRVIEMTRIAVGHGAPDLDEGRIPKHWEPFQWQRLVKKIVSGRGLMLALQQLRGDQAEGITPLLSRQTPLAVHMFRHTRATLRAYQERGLIKALAVRMPEDIPVVFQTEREKELYHRIDELCSQFYRLADLPEDERKGVGFLMAVFRKRLSSSFSAFTKSLERRRDVIEAIERNLADLDARLRTEKASFQEEDDEDEDLDSAQSMETEHQRLLRLYRDPNRRDELKNERLYLQNYIVDLRQITVDSKFEAFKERLLGVLAEDRRVIVFSQYLDTLDFIRERLVSNFGDQMACYSGRGGEIWDPTLNGWCVVEKSEIKARSKKEHSKAIKILLGTEAASEGLNLQQFSALINYDIPWNPMRIEQRIGRIDRIGQEAPFVSILNLYVKDTIEEDTYYTLKNRIGIFEEVVGPLQPILAEMPRIFRKVARGEMELADARKLLEEAAKKEPEVAISSFEQCVQEEPLNSSTVTESSAPVSQSQLAAWCLGHPAQGMRAIAVPEPGMDSIDQDGTKACLSIVWACAPPYLGIGECDEILATFNGELADRHPPTGPTQNEDGIGTRAKGGVRLLTWGDPYLQAWLESIRGDQLTDEELKH
jgi:ERCC4-related helicase